MEKLTINPGRVDVFGNIITNQHGYVEDISDFESHKCTLQAQETIHNGWEEFNVYSFKMELDEYIENQFNEDIQYCTSDSASDLFVCEHLNMTLEESLDYFEVIRFHNGYFLKVKEEYLTDGVDLTSSFFLLIHQDNKGVEIPSGTEKIRFTSNYSAKNTIENISVGFVFFDENGVLIENQEGENIVNEATGPVGRLNIATDEIPDGAKYVSVEFSFPEGVQYGDYIVLQLNCLLFNSDYEGFIKN